MEVLVLGLASGAIAIAIVALVIWLAARRGAQLGTRRIVQRSRLTCPRCGRTFDFDWFPGASLTSFRLGKGRYMACPLCGRWSCFDLYDTMMARPNRPSETLEPPGRGSGEMPLTTPPTIRDLQWTDMDPFIDTYWALYEERARGEPIGIHLSADRPSRSDEVAWFANLYRRVLEGDTICTVAERDGRAVGHCEIGPVSGSQPGSETYHVGELGILVDARFRGQGCGAALIARALEQARGRFHLVRLTVFSTNIGARRLYERRGFTVTGRLPSAVRRGNQYIDLELMCIDLRPGAPPARGTNR